MIKNGEKVTKQILYILRFIDGTRFMAISLSKLFNNLADGIDKLKCKYGQKKKRETCENKYIKIAGVFLNTETMM